MFPEVNFNQVELEDALDFFREGTRLYDPERKGVCMVVLRPRETPPITFHAVDITARKVLDEICKQAGLHWHAERSAIVIKQRAER